MQEVYDEIQKRLKSPIKWTFCSSLVIRRKGPQSPLPLALRKSTAEVQSRQRESLSTLTASFCLTASYFYPMTCPCLPECVPANGGGEWVSEQWGIHTGRRRSHLSPFGQAQALTLHWEHVLWG